MQHKVRTTKRLHWHALVLTVFPSSWNSFCSCHLYLAEAAFSRCTCSALNLFLTLSNAQGPGWFTGITQEGAGGKKGRIWKLEGGQASEKKKEWTLRGGTEFVNTLSVRGAKRSNNTLSNGWPPSPHVNFYTLRLKRHIKKKVSFMSSSFLTSLHISIPCGRMKLWIRCWC